MAIQFLLKIIPFLSNARGFLKGQWKAIASVLIAVAIFGTGWYIDNLKDKIDESEGVRKELALMVRDCQDTNAENLRTVRALESAVLRLRRSVEVTDEEAREAAAEAARREAEAKAQLTQTITELEELRNAEPSCAAIADLDIGAACPAATQRLREQARNPSDN